jgi:anaerobic selenocysteine-containing dehydrogenase
LKRAPHRSLCTDEDALCLSWMGQQELPPVQVKLSVCRNCGSFCPTLVTLDEGRVLSVDGDPDAPIYKGFICPKGRDIPRQHHLPGRLLHPLKRLQDGSRIAISSEQAVAEIADRLSIILAESGPESVAMYLGGGVAEQNTAPGVMRSFLAALGSPMFFSALTIDQPGLVLANALHGKWEGGRIHPRRCEALLIVGGNPVVSKQHLPQNPGQELKALASSGTKLIVIDPRRSETALRAAVHLQVIPGEDPTVLAGLIRLIFELEGVDAEFVSRNTEGAAALREAVAGFTPEYVAARAGIRVDDLLAAANILNCARTGDTALGVGASMATRGTLSSFLALCIQSLRGFWAKAGDEVSRPRMLLPPEIRKAQPSGPRRAWGFGRHQFARGLQQTAAGMPTAALPDLLLSTGRDRIRALFLHAGAMYSWPDQRHTAEALGALDLLVMHDVELTATSALAHYVIATRRQLETPAFSQPAEQTGAIHPGYDWTQPWAFYRPATLEPPHGSDTLEAWQTYYRLSRQLGLSLNIGNQPLDMLNEPTSDDILELYCRDSVIPLSRVKQHPHGALFDQARNAVGARDADCVERLQLADAAMLAELRELRHENVLARRHTDEEFPLLLICKRMLASTNSGVRVEEHRKHPPNPAFMHPDDLAARALQPGDRVEIRSRFGSIISFVAVDAHLRPGVLAMTHGYGARFGKDYDPGRDGANVNDLLSWVDDPDRYHGMPRMSAVPVSLHRLPEPEQS